MLLHALQVVLLFLLFETVLSHRDQVLLYSTLTEERTTRTIDLRIVTMLILL